MTVEAKLDAVLAKLDTLTTPPAPDLSGLAAASELAAVSAKLDALIATVGTEPPTAA